MSGREKRRDSADSWKDNLAEVTVRRGRTVYRPNKNTELPALLQSQVIASRDPRLSPSLPNTSIYSRDFDLEDDNYQFDDGESGSFNSEDWYMDDVSDFEEQAKQVKVKVHVNPKFLDGDRFAEKTVDKTEDDDKSKEKVSTWLHDSDQPRSEKGTPSRQSVEQHKNREQIQQPKTADQRKESKRDTRKELADEESSYRGREPEIQKRREEGEYYKSKEFPSKGREEKQLIRTEKEYEARSRSREPEYDKRLKGKQDEERLKSRPDDYEEWSRSRQVNEDRHKGRQENFEERYKNRQDDYEERSRSKQGDPEEWQRSKHDNNAVRLRSRQDEDKMGSRQDDYEEQFRSRKHVDRSREQDYEVQRLIQEQDMPEAQEQKYEMERKSRVHAKSKHQDYELRSRSIEPRLEVKRSERSWEREENRGKLEESEYLRQSKEKEFEGSIKLKKHGSVESERSRSRESRVTASSRSKDNEIHDLDRYRRNPREQVLEIAEPDEFERFDVNRVKPPSRRPAEMDMNERLMGKETRRGKVIEEQEYEKRSVSRGREFRDAESPDSFRSKEPGRSKLIKRNEIDSPDSHRYRESDKSRDIPSSKMSAELPREVKHRQDYSNSKAPRGIKESPSFVAQGREESHVSRKQEFMAAKLSKREGSPRYGNSGYSRKESIEKRRQELPEGPESPTKVSEPVATKKQWKEVKDTSYSPDRKIETEISPNRLSPPLAQKSIPMFPDESIEHSCRSPSPMIRGSLFGHIKPLQTKEFGKKKNKTEEKEGKIIVKHETMPEICDKDKKKSEKQSPTADVPSEEHWQNKPLETQSYGCLNPLSSYARRNVEVNGSTELIDRMIESHRRDIQAELDKACKGKLTSKYDKPWKHLDSLSLETQLESTFAESAMVKRVYLAAMKEWMTTKPLDKLLSNPKGTEAQSKPENLKSSLKTDKVIKSCLNNYATESYGLVNGDKPSSCVNVFPQPMSAVEESVDEVYRQVHQYMDFLSKKGISDVQKGLGISPIKPPVQGVPKPVQPPVQSYQGFKRKVETNVPNVPVGLAYSPSRPTGQEEEDDENYYDPTMSPKKRKFDDKRKDKKKDKKEKKHKKKDKSKKAKKKRKERRSLTEEGDDNRQEFKSPESDSSGSESPQSARRYSENIESPRRDERMVDPKDIEEPPSRWTDDHNERRERRDSDRYEKRDQDRDYDYDRHDYGRGYSRKGNRHHADAFWARKTERERKSKARDVMRICIDKLLSIKPCPDEPVQESTLETWNYVHQIMHQECSYVHKQLVEATKHLSHDFEPDKGFIWAVVLAVHSQVLQDAQDRMAMEEATAAAAKVEQELEEGELEASPVHEPMKDDKIKEELEKDNDKAKKAGKGSHRNKLLNAFRQQMAAKKREELGIVQKVEVSKLSPAMAAKKPKPSSSRPLFKPPAAFEMLKAAQEERERQRRRRMHIGSSSDDGPLKFDGVVREGLVSDALKSFFHLTDDVLQAHNPQLADDFMNYVFPVAIETMNVVKQHMGLAAMIVIVVKERREKEKLREASKKEQQGDHRDDDNRTTDDERSPSRKSNDALIDIEKPPDKPVSAKKTETTNTTDDTTVVDMDMDDELEGGIEVNEYGTEVNEYGSVIERKEEIPKLKQPIKLTSTSKFIKQKESIQEAFGDTDEKSTKRKLEVLSDDEEKDNKKVKESTSEISKEKMVVDEKLEFDVDDSGEVSKKLERMQKGGVSSNKHVAAERIQAIVSEGPKEEIMDDTEDPQLILNKFTPVSGTPEVDSNTSKQISDKSDENKDKKAVVESVISVKGNPVATASAPLPKAKSPASKPFKPKGWGVAPKASCTSSQKVSAQDILARLQEKAKTSTPEDKKSEESSKGEEPGEDDLYQTALTSKDNTDWGEVNSPAEKLPPLPEDEAPPLPPEPVASPPKDTTPKSTINSGVVAKAAPQISKPPVTFPPLPDTSQPPPPLPGAEAKTFPGNFQQYPPPAPNEEGQQQQQAQNYGWGDYQNYNNHHWDGYQWVAGPPPWGQGWPPPTWQPPPPSTSSSDWNWSSSNQGMPSWPANWQQPPPQHGSWNSGQWSNANQSSTTMTTTTTTDYGDLPPGEEPPVPQVWPFKQSQPKPLGDGAAHSGGQAVSSVGDSSVASGRKKPEWKKPPFPYKPVLPSPDRLRMYAFNREKLMCKSVDALLTEMEQEKFDPYNLACLSYLPDMDAAVVLIHQDDKNKLHLIPNLAKLKQHPKVKFATYFDANEVAMQKFQLLFPSGGMLIADDNVLLGLQPAALKEVCRFMVTASKSKEKGLWSLIVHEHIMTKLNIRKLDITNTSQEVLRISNLVDTIEQYRNEGVIEVLQNHRCNTAERPAHEYVHCSIKLQEEKANKHRHVFLLSDVKMTNEKSSQFLDSGIGIISVPDFLQTYAGKSISAPMVALPRPAYGKRSSAMFDDCPLTNAAQELEVEKIKTDVLKSLHDKPVKKPLLPNPPMAPKLGEVVRPDANVRPSEGRYDGSGPGPGRGGWMPPAHGDMPPRL